MTNTFVKVVSAIWIIIFPFICSCCELKCIGGVVSFWRMVNQYLFIFSSGALSWRYEETAAHTPSEWQEVCLWVGCVWRHINRLQSNVSISWDARNNCTALLFAHKSPYYFVYFTALLLILTALGHSVYVCKCLASCIVHTCVVFMIQVLKRYLWRYKNTWLTLFMCLDIKKSIRFSCMAEASSPASTSSSRREISPNSMETWWRRDGPLKRRSKRSKSHTLHFTLMDCMYTTIQKFSVSKVFIFFLLKSSV